MADSKKIQISEGTQIVELQQEVAFLRNRALVLSEMLLQADGEVTRLTTELADTVKMMEQVIVTANDAEVAE